MTRPTVDEKLRIVVEKIENEQRLRDRVWRGRVHTDFVVSNPRQRNRFCVTLWTRKKAYIRSGNSQRRKIVF